MSFAIEFTPDSLDTFRQFEFDLQESILDELDRLVEADDPIGVMQLLDRQSVPAGETFTCDISTEADGAKWIVFITIKLLANPRRLRVRKLVKMPA